MAAQRRGTTSDPVRPSEIWIESPEENPASRGQAELTHLVEIGRALLQAQLDQDQLCELIYQLAGEIVPVEFFQLGLFDGDRYLIKVWVKEGQRQAPTVFLVPEGQGIIGWMRATHQPLLVRDFEAERDALPARPSYISDQPPRSAVFLPMLAGKDVIGALVIQSCEPAAFDEGHLRLLGVLANQSASALNNARLYERGQRRLNDLTTVAEVGRKLATILDLNELLAQVVELIRSRFGYYHVQIFLVEQGSDRAYFMASSGHDLSEKWQREGRTMGIGRDGIIGWVAQRGEMLLANDVVAEPRYIPDDPRLLPDTRAELAVPLIVEDQVLGVLDVQSTEVGGFGQNDIFVLRTLADQVAVAVYSARAYEAQQEEAWISTMLLQVAEAVRRLQPVDTTLAQVARMAQVLTGVDRCAVLLKDEDGAFRARTVHALRPELAEAYRDAVIRPGDLPLIEDACRLGQPLVVADALRSPRVPESWRTRFDSCTILVVPLLVADEPIGVLLADDVDATHMFSPRRVRILSGIANQAAVAIENARLQAQEAERARLGRELELAHDIQRSLLPSEAPSLPGYQIVYRWRSAREVGGDFFDFLRLSDSRVGLVIADVSDKGIPAALYMMFARTLLRAVAFSRREPAATLVRANDLIVSDSSADMFVTAYYSILDVRNHLLTYASAGHNLALYAPAGEGAPEPMTTAGIVLGIVSPVTIGQKTLYLAPGDVVLFYTDGVTEAVNAASEEFGSARLAALVVAHRDQPAEAIADAIEAAVHEFAGDAPQFDDFTLILLKRDNGKTSPTIDIQDLVM